MPLSFAVLVRRLSAAFVATFLGGSVIAAELPAGITQGPAVEGVTEYRLENGLRVLFAPDASKPTTTVNMTYLVGSRHENYGETGMAHLLEHLLFKGTATTRNALGEMSRRGLQANGSTSSDRTNYYASFAANSENLDWYLGWQADAMVNSLIAREDLDSEMTVVRNEMESGENNPFRVLMQRMEASAYEWHNYGKSTIGARSDVENVDIGRLQAFYRLYYQPDNAVLIVTGKFDPAATLKTVSQAFGKIPRPQRTLPRLYTTEPVQDGERSVTLRRAGGVPIVAAMYHIPAAADPAFVPFDLANTILGDTPSGRLYHAMVPTKEAASVFGYTMTQFDPGMTLFAAQLEPGMDADRALGTLTTTLENLAAKPFTNEELERARSKFMTSWQRIYSDPEQVGAALSESVAAGDWRLFFLHRDRGRDAKLEDVQQAANHYLLQSNRTSGRYIPTVNPPRAPATVAVDVDAILKDYKGDPGFVAVDAFDPTPENIDRQTRRTQLDLPNGPVYLSLLPKPTRGNMVQARLLIQAGELDQFRGKRTTAMAMADLLERGTPTLSRQQIQDRFDQLQAEVSIGGMAGNLQVSMTTTREHLPKLTALVLDIVRQANFPQDQIDEYQRQMASSIQQSMTEPRSVAARALGRYANPYPKDDVRYMPSFEESLENVRAINRDALQAFHDQFVGTGSVYFTAVGAFDPEAIQTTLKAGLADWKRAPAYTRIPSPYNAVPPKAFDVNTPDKANAFFLSRVPMKLQDTDADYAALYVANYLLGASETSRLWNRVREKEGLSYTVRSDLSVSSFEPDANWTIYAIYAPENRERLQRAVNEELARAVKEGFTAEEVKDGIASLLSYRRLARSQDDVLVSAWQGYRVQQRTFAWSAEMDEKIAALTPEKINTALRSHLKPEDFSSVYAGDFTRAQAAKPAQAEKPAPAGQPKVN